MNASLILRRLALAALVGLAGGLAVQGFHMLLSLAERISVGSDQGLVAAARALSPLRRLLSGRGMNLRPDRYWPVMEFSDAIISSGVP